MFKVISAPCGFGKTTKHIIPAILSAIKSRSLTVVAVPTKCVQDQIMSHPDLASATDVLLINSDSHSSPVRTLKKYLNMKSYAVLVVTHEALFMQSPDDLARADHIHIDDFTLSNEFTQLPLDKVVENRLDTLSEYFTVATSGDKLSLTASSKLLESMEASGKSIATSMKWKPYREILSATATHTIIASKKNLEDPKAKSLNVLAIPRLDVLEGLPVTFYGAAFRDTMLYKLNSDKFKFVVDINTYDFSGFKNPIEINYVTDFDISKESAINNAGSMIEKLNKVAKITTQAKSKILVCANKAAYIDPEYSRVSTASHGRNDLTNCNVLHYIAAANLNPVMTDVLGLIGITPDDYFKAVTLYIAEQTVMRTSLRLPSTYATRHARAATIRLNFVNKRIALAIADKFAGNRVRVNGVSVESTQAHVEPTETPVELTETPVEPSEPDHMSALARVSAIARDSRIESTHTSTRKPEMNPIRACVESNKDLLELIAARREKCELQEDTCSYILDENTYGGRYDD